VVIELKKSKCDLNSLIRGSADSAQRCFFMVRKRSGSIPVVGSIKWRIEINI
jgi:hypothetical protein